jgi:CubicO group peptidase (beta-lactamase class C family)
LEDAEGAADMMSALPQDLPMLRAAPLALYPTPQLGNRTDILSADIPAGGKTSARAIARMSAALLDEVNGVRLISPERLREATAVSTSGADEVFGMPSSWGLGYSIGLPGSTAQDTPTAFEVGGVGGSFAYANTATGIAFALTKNRLTTDFTVSTQISRIVAGAH